VILALGEVLVEQTKRGFLIEELGMEPRPSNARFSLLSSVL
jgi:hypothetical protein